MVIMKKIGQSACLSPNGTMLAYGEASETERIWVDNDGLSNQSQLKIQSSPFGNLRDIRVLTLTKLSTWLRKYFINYLLLLF